ncbi:MAG: MBL fold metallo-hydrolase [Caldilineales bacterium]|nr:MBL fold metallo-hydrolase [Caldilineales bacterium]
MSVTTIHYLGHATLLIQLDGLNIITDPVLGDRVLYLKRLGPSGTAWMQQLPDPDLILLSHLHLDHFHIPTLRRLSADLPMLAPRKALRVLKLAVKQKLIGVEPGDDYEMGGVNIGTTFAVHGRTPELTPLDAAQGYLLKGSKTIYFPGDTDVFPEMAEIGDQGVDLALLPVWGWGPNLGAGHMDPSRAVEALALLRPRMAIPIHWGSFNLLGAHLLGPMAHLINPGPQFKELAAEHAPNVQVHLLPPGESFILE